MPQHFNQPQSTPPIAAFVPTEIPAPLAGEATFTALSPQGQQTVGDYLAHVERGLQGGMVGPGYFDFEQAETVRELQSHLLSLIVAFQELGDDEPKAIAAALAQFGAARMVCGGLRRAETRNRLMQWLQKDDGIGPAVLLPMALFAAALATPIIMDQFFAVLNVAYHIQSQSLSTPLTAVLGGWPAFMVPPFLAGMLNGHLSRKRAGTGLATAAVLVLGTLILTGVSFYDAGDTSSPVIQATMRTLVSEVAALWLLSAGLGLGLVRGANSLSRRKQAV